MRVQSFATFSPSTLAQRAIRELAERHGAQSRLEMLTRPTIISFSVDSHCLSITKDCQEFTARMHRIFLLFILSEYDDVPFFDAFARWIQENQHFICQEWSVSIFVGIDGDAETLRADIDALKADLKSNLPEILANTEGLFDIITKP